MVALARLVQVNDAALDAIYASQNGREDVRAHADLVFDTYKRLLAPVSAPATGEAGSAERYSMGKAMTRTIALEEAFLHPRVWELFQPLCDPSTRS